MTLPAFKGRVTAIDAVTADVRVIGITPVHQGMHGFSPGQYMMLSMGGHEFRPYSIASSPQNPVLEFHIRDQGHGLSHYAANTLKTGDEVLMQGPLGVSFALPDNKPLLLIAGGVGISPVKSIAENYIHSPHKDGVRQLHIVWGVRAASQLYLDGLFSKWKQDYPFFSYTSAAGLDITQALGSISDDFSHMAVYMAGPTPMIDAALAFLLSKNVERSSIFSDAFTV